MSWEAKLSDSSSHMTSPYWATVTVILFVSYISIIIGIVEFFIYFKAYPNLNFCGYEVNTVCAVVSALLIVAIIIEFIFWRIFSRQWKQARVSNYGVGVEDN